MPARTNFSQVVGNSRRNDGHCATSASRDACSCALSAATSARATRRALRASAEYPPCRHRARRLRCNPLAVRGPVLRPPCNRQRRLPRQAGARHGRRVRLERAPHRLASEKRPAGLPFFSHPMCCVRVAAFRFELISWCLPALVGQVLRSDKLFKNPSQSADGLKRYLQLWRPRKFAATRMRKRRVHLSPKPPHPSQITGTTNDRYRDRIG